MSSVTWSLADTHGAADFLGDDHTVQVVDATPNAFNCHSTQEYLSIRECRYFYDKMAELLEKMKDM